ncbi:MAG TPA: hypothetical protein VKR06_46300 [Ktedonosporobacter sp.]|nr:hypothetical protein [Ktedonosporobacter sp.]
MPDQDSRPLPVLETTMNQHGLKISLASEKEALSVTLPSEMVDALCLRWQTFQNGTATESALWGRHYTGHWPDLDSLGK